MPTAFSLSLIGCTSAFKDVNTSTINSRLARSSSTTRSLSGVTSRSSSKPNLTRPSYARQWSTVDQPGSALNVPVEHVPTELKGSLPTLEELEELSRLVRQHRPKDAPNVIT